MPTVAGLGFEEDMQVGWKRRLGFQVRVSIVLMGCKKASTTVYGSDLALGLNKSKIARGLSRLPLLAFYRHFQVSGPRTGRLHAKP